MSRIRVEQVKIKCGYSLGDVVVLTGAVRELHLQYPKRFRTDIVSGFPDVWRGNPFVSPAGPNARVIDCSEMHVDRTGETKTHYQEAYVELLNRRLGTRIVSETVGGDIYLSAEEQSWYSAVQELSGVDLPFWIICSGGKFDIPIKWWSHGRYQAVVDHFKGRILFVQVGGWGNYHPRLKGSVDLRGLTRIRDLIHLVYCSHGVLCGVTSLMHLSAAVPFERGRPRATVVVAGAREPATWERYPTHEFHGNNVAFECSCCWRGDYRSSPVDHALKRGSCENVRNALPACMDAVSADDVIASIEGLLASQKSTVLNPNQIASSQDAICASERNTDFEEENVTELNAVGKAEDFVRNMPSYPRGRFAGRGIVVCGGGTSYFTNAWVCIRMLRHQGCALPIELWHLGRHEVDEAMEALVAPFGVTCVNARRFFRRQRFRNPLGWELKSYAILHSGFREILFLDADNVPVRNPEFLFSCPEYLERRAVFWPDFGRLGPRRRIWKLTGVSYQREPEFETGQMLIDKKRSWEALNLAFWYNDHSEFFFKYIYGDKETFHLAWRKLGKPYAMVPHKILRLPGTMCQKDFAGRVLFQHRNRRKWRLFGENTRVNGFKYEKECLEYLEDLRRVWDGRINGKRELFERNGVFFRTETWDEQIYHSVVAANEYRMPDSFSADDVIIDVGAHVGSFSIAARLRGSRSIYAFEPDPDNYALARKNCESLEGITLCKAAVLDRSGPAALQSSASETGNTGGIRLVFSNAEAKGAVCRALPLDDILRRFSRVKLLKLDCEGSEWPILMNSRELSRVEGICGEYHECQEHPLCARTELTRVVLRNLLRARFKSVRTKSSRDRRFGWFWATDPLQSVSSVLAWER